MTDIDRSTTFMEMETENGIPRLSLASRLTFAVAERIRFGTFEITVPEGVTRRFGGQEPGPVGRLVVRNNRFIRRMILGGNIGLGESYGRRLGQPQSSGFPDGRGNELRGLWTRR